MPDMKKLLVIDDERDFVDSLRTRLEFEGYEVIEANDGDAGLAIMREQQLDGVLLDIMMPGKDGFRVYEEMQADEALKKLPVIIVTAFGRLLSKEERDFIGDAPFIRKPFEMDELLEMIRSARG